MGVILVANHKLATLGGSETFTFTIIEELVRRGLDVQYFTFERGLVSEKIENELGVSFFTKEKKYELIFANHYSCVEKLFCYGLVIQTCHGIYPKLEKPSKFASLHVSISEEIRLSLKKKGFKSTVIYNSVNLNRFNSKNKINVNLKNVLSLCHSEQANSRLYQICDKLGLNFFSLNKLVNPIWDVENIINNADLVVGLGRSAIEAIACGRPIIVFDDRDYFPSYSDGYLSDVFFESLVNNFSGRARKLELSDEQIANEFLKYKRSDGVEMLSYASELFNVVKAVDSYISYAKKQNIKLNISLSGVLILLKSKLISRIYFYLRYKFFKEKSWFHI